MLQRLMVPLDGSAFAEAALPTAFHLARRDSARVQLVMVREPPLPLTRTGNAPVRDPALDQELLQEARSYLDVLLGRIAASDRAHVSTALLLGSTVETLADRVRDEAVDLVVMTTHGRGGVGRAWLGSAADGLVRRSPAPTLLLRPGEGTEGQGEGGFPRVLVPLDGSPTGDRMIEHAIAVAGVEQVEYILLRVLAASDSPLRATLPQRGETASSRTQRATVEALLASRAEALRSRGLTVSAHIVVDDSAARGILDYAAEGGVGLIAMATRSRGGLERMLLGSVADKVLRGWESPLLLWNPAEAEASAASRAARPPPPASRD